MKKLPLRPYHGSVWVCRTLKELRAAYRAQTKSAYPYEDDLTGGRFIKLEGKNPADTLWLVYGYDKAALAHEFAHVLLHTFKLIGHDPREGDGEAFCYMLSQLMQEAA